MFGNFRDSSYHPSFAALSEDGLEVAFEQSTRVLDVLFGVGFGSGDARKRFVEQADNSPLFGKWGKLNWNILKPARLDAFNSSARPLSMNPILRQIREKQIF